MRKKILLLLTLACVASNAMAQLSVYAEGQVSVGTAGGTYADGAGANSTTVKLSADGKVIGTKRTITK